MIKVEKQLFLVLVLLLGSLKSFSQSHDNQFDIYVMNWRFGPKPLEYFAQNNIVVTNMLTSGSIEDPAHKGEIDVVRVQKYLRNLFHHEDSKGKLIIDWEGKAYQDVRDYPITDSRYKMAEAEWKKLISVIRQYRPNVQIGIYGTPFRGWSSGTVQKFNPDKKYDQFFSLVDFLAPSVYLLYADEEVGHERNLQYICDNMNVALDYGRRLHKPVYPFFWHRINPNSSKRFGNELIQIDVFAHYVKFLANYSYNGYKASGMYWWEVLSKNHRLSRVNGINGWSKGLVTDLVSYDDLMVRYATAVLDALKERS